MARLLAQGPERQHRWRRPIQPGQTIRVGRECGPWSVDWDRHISRHHFAATFDGQQLAVEMLAEAKNPVYFRGKPCDRFHVRPGEHFVVGATRFSLLNDRLSLSLVDPRPSAEQTFAVDQLRDVRFRHARRQVDALGRLPDLVTGADSELELAHRAADLLLEGVPGARGVAVVRCGSRQGEEILAETIEVVHWDSLEPSGRFSPSLALLRDALQNNQAIVRRFARAMGREESTRQAETCGPVTPSEAAAQLQEGKQAHWAYCMPSAGIAQESGDEQWAFYVAGEDPDSASPAEVDSQLQDALKFTQLVATTVGNVRQLRRMQRRAATLRQFFSQPVREVLEQGDPQDVLEPSESEVSVLFCDLRGFSRQSEQLSGDLLQLLGRVSQALGIMTGEILRQGGVIGDFHGDSAMGFWGWPLAEPDSPLRAAAAALEIADRFRRQAMAPGAAMSGFRVGIGVATGRAVAGRIGTTDQVKVTAFGPVVNLASRLEGMTRRFGAAVLLDGATAGHLRSRCAQLGIEPEQLRPLFRVEPYGMSQQVDVWELLSLPDVHRFHTGPQVDRHRRLMEAFHQGNWQRALTLLKQQHPADPIAPFLRSYLDAYPDGPPHDWEGVVRLESK